MALERNVKKKPARTADRRNVWLLILTTLLIVVSVVLFTPPNEKINQGLDIQGGLSVVLTAKSTDGAPVTPEDMEKSRAIIESRVNALGASEATVQEQGSDQILVQIPGLADTEEALATIGRTGSLEFARLDSFTDEDVKNAIDSGQTSGEGTVTDEFGNAFPSGQVEHMAVEAGTYTPIVTGADITNVTIGRESEGSTYYSVNITLNSQGAKAFADASRDLVADHGKIVIILDGEVQSAPAVQSEIPNGEVSITGQYSLEDAKALQTILESGSLPVSFEYAQSQVVGPTLGQDALVSGVVVALIGLAVVMLYLLFFYKGLGIITAAAMAVFARALPRHPGGPFRLPPVQSVAGGHRRHRADHRYGCRLLHPYRGALPRGDPHGPIREGGLHHRREARHLHLHRRRPRDHGLGAVPVLPRRRLRQGLRYDAGLGHHLRHRHDAHLQGAAYPPARAEGHCEAPRLLGH